MTSVAQENESTSYNVFGAMPYLLIFVGLIFVVAPIAQFGVRPDNPQCQQWNMLATKYGSIADFVKANHGKIITDGSSVDAMVPKNFYSDWSNACHFGQVWLMFGIFTTLFGLGFLVVPKVFDKASYIISRILPYALGFQLFSCLWVMISMFSFYGLGDAWTYSWKCVISSDSPFTAGCNWYDSDDKPFPIPAGQAAKYFSSITGPYFFEVYALRYYATTAAVLTVFGMVFVMFGSTLVYLQYRNAPALSAATSAKSDVPTKENLARAHMDSAPVAITFGRDIPISQP